VSRGELPSGGPARGLAPQGGLPAFLVLLWVGAAYGLFQLLITLLSLRDRVLDLVTLGLAQAVAYLIVIFGLLHRYEPGTPLRRALGLRPTHPGLVFAGVGLGASLKLPLESLTNLVERHFPVSDAQLVARAELFRIDGVLDLIALSTVTCLVAPLVEELLFRGAAFGRVVKAGALAAAVATGLSFVLVHSDPRHWPALVLVSAALSFLRVASGSLLPPLALHVTFNAAGVLALALGAASATRPLEVPLVVTAMNWLTACVILAFAVRAAERPEAVRARAEDRS
jgi:membrane protease YdiL (CAAX protease family)